MYAQATQASGVLLQHLPGAAFIEGRSYARRTAGRGCSTSPVLPSLRDDAGAPGIRDERCSTSPVLPSLREACESRGIELPESCSTSPVLPSLRAVAAGSRDAPEAQLQHLPGAAFIEGLARLHRQVQPLTSCSTSPVLPSLRVANLIGRDTRFGLQHLPGAAFIEGRSSGAEGTCDGRVAAPPRCCLH